MQYIRLGNTGLIVSRLAFGVMTFWYRGPVIANSRGRENSPTGSGRIDQSFARRGHQLF